MAFPAPASSFSKNPRETEIEIEGQSLPYYDHHASAIEASSFAAAFNSTAAGSSNYRSWNVFINCPDPDVQMTFASHLYRHLILHGLQVFIDQQELLELREGESFSSQRINAIKTASVHVAIFSPRYAESAWCLDELTLMLQSGATIIPVFYGVKPSELRFTRGKYGEALRNLENKTYEGKPRYDSGTIEKWRNALSRVADISTSGFELEACNGDEGELLERVVGRVMKKLEIRLFVAKYPTGLEEKVEDLERVVLSQQHSEKPRVIGIVGLGGIGKTTLATEFFNRNCSKYNRSFFLRDIRENARYTSLSILQRKLLSGLTGMNYPIDSIHEGILMLRKYLSKYSVLVILDDVDDMSQVEAFSPLLTGLLSDSLILITSRDKHVLLSSGVEMSAIYVLTGFNTQHSRELFCSYAFTQSHPRPGFEDLVDKFIKACDGLPLSLKVFGALLCGQTKSYWVDRLESLQEILPPDIQRRLKISYDALSMEEQHIFLDIACFFIGKERDMAIRIWDGSGWKGLVGFANVQNKCLVEVDSSNEIHMHDHLRHMGRKIAESPGLPRRLWREIKFIDDLLQQFHGQVVTDVRGIKTLSDARTGSDDDSSELPWYKRSSYEVFGSWAMSLRNRLHNTPYCGIGIRKLQLLATEGGMLEQILRRVQSPNLIWLRWYKCPYSSLPSWIPMKNLRVLEVRGNKLQHLWHAEHQSPWQLRQLDIVSPLSKLPKSIGRLRHLERIVLKESKLKTLPDEFSDLRSLKRFELTNCSMLKSLPDSFGDLLNLEYIDLSYSSDLQMLPNSFGHLIRLKYLNLSYCRSLTMSSRALKNISMLEYINFSYCYKIEELPLQVAQLTKLRTLEVTRCSELEELPSFETSVALEELRASYCVKLKSIQGLAQLTKLRTLEVTGCTELEELPSFETLVSLEELRASYCVKLKNIQGLAQLTKLQTLEITGCSELEELPSFETSVALEELRASYCVKLKSIQGLAQLTKLQTLEVTGCTELEELPSFETLVSLEELRASYCVKLKSIQGLAQLTKLRTLDVSECSELEALPGVEHLRSLQYLGAKGCPQLQWGDGVVDQLRQRFKALEIGRAERAIKT